MAFRLATAIAWAPGKRQKMTQDDILADAHSRITTKQQLTVPQIAYTELWVSAKSPQSSLLIVPCGLRDTAECLLRPSCMPGSSSVGAGLRSGVSRCGQLSAASNCTCGKAGGCVHQALKIGMQVRRMLKGDMACPTDKKERQLWAQEEAILQAIVLGKLLGGKTKWYTRLELQQ